MLVSKMINMFLFQDRLMLFEPKSWCCLVGAEGGYLADVLPMDTMPPLGTGVAVHDEK